MRHRWERGTARPHAGLAASALALLAAAIVPAHSAALPPNANARDVLALSPSAVVAGMGVGVTLAPDGEGLILAGSGVPEGAPPRSVGIAESQPIPLAGPSAIDTLAVEANVPRGARLEAEIRGLRPAGWTEWGPGSDPVALDGVRAIQTRLWLHPGPDGASPRVRGVRVEISPAALVTAQLPGRGPPTVKVWASRIGLVGNTTANGHVITERDRFVSLPSRRPLNRQGAAEYTVQISYRGRTTVAPVWDVGPWNTRDDYWNDAREQFNELPRWLPQAEAAFFSGHNGGRDGRGRYVTVPTAIDLADGTFWDDLGMTASDWVDVTFLWVDAPSPPPRSARTVTPKVAPPGPAPPATPPRQVRAASHNAPRPGFEVYLPLLIHDPAGWTSSWTVQNPSPALVRGATTLYNAGGNPVSQLSFALPPLGSTTFSPAEAPGVGPGFVGAGIVRASGPVAAVANVDRSPGDRLAYEGISEPAPRVALPLVFREYHGWSTAIQVQNLSPLAVTAQIAYVSASGGAWRETAALAPFAHRAFYTSATSGLPPGFVGSASAETTGGQPLAVVVSLLHQDGGATAYPGATAAGERLYAPLLFKRYNGWSTGLQLFNAGSAPAGVSVIYQASPPAAGEAIESGVVPPGGSLTFYQPAVVQLPDGFVGSASVVGSPGSQLIGLVNEVRGGATVAMNYLLGGPPSPLAPVPLVTKGLDGWDTGIQVQNPGGAPTAGTITFYDEAGAPVHRLEDVLDPGAARSYYPPAMPEIPAGFRGSAIIQTTSPGAPGLLVVVNHTSR